MQHRNIFMQLFSVACDHLRYMFSNYCVSYEYAKSSFPFFSFLLYTYSLSMNRFSNQVPGLICSFGVPFLEIIIAQF